MNIEQIVKSSALDYSHFISLPLAIHPQLVDKLINFRNSVLGINDANSNVVFGSSSNSESIEVDASKIPVVSYPPKSTATFASESKTPTLTGMWTKFP